MDVTSRIIMITAQYEAQFNRKILTGSIAATFNSEYTAFAIDNKNVFVYPNKVLWSEISDIFKDPTISKIISKPAPALKAYLKGVKCENCHNLSEYIKEKGDPRIIPELKREIIDSDTIKLLDERAANVALIMMKYKIQTDLTGKPAKKPKKSYFNKNRDCYLHYLTAYNDLLSRHGPLRFSDLLRMIRDYPYLCRVTLHPAMALEGLIKVGALSNDPKTTLVSIPDQMPKMASSSLVADLPKITPTSNSSKNS